MGASKFDVGVIFSAYALVGFISSPFIGLLVSVGLKPLKWFRICNIQNCCFTNYFRSVLFEVFDQRGSLCQR